MKQYELNGKIVGVVVLKYEPYFEPMIINESNSSYLITKKKVDKGFKTIRHSLIGTGWQILSLASEMTEEKSNTLGMTLQEFKEWLTSLGFVVENELNEAEHTIGIIKSIQYQQSQKLVQNLLIIVKEK